MKLMSKVRSRAAKRVLAVVAGAMVVLGITAVPAFAHNPGISASIDCSGKVSFSSTSWTTGDRGRNEKIEIQANVDFKGWNTVSTGSYTGNDYTFTGSFTVPTTAKDVWVRSYAATAWADGTAGGSYSVNTVKLTRPTNCTTSAPAASISHNCTTYTAALDNTASTVAVDFVVTVNGTSTTYNVGPGVSRDVTGPVTEDTDYTISVTSGGKTLDSESFRVDCTSNDVIEPKATVTHDCDTITAALDNADSNVPVVFTVTINGEDQTYTVDAGATRDVTAPVTPETAYTIVVKANGTTLDTDDISATECQTTPPVVEPTATVTHDCDLITARLDNSGSTVEVEFTVTINGEDETYTVEAGDSRDVTEPVTPETAYDVSVSAAGNELATDSIDEDECQTAPPTSEPTAEITHTCETYTANLDNTGSDEAVDFVVTVNGTATTVTVPAGDTQQTSGPVTEDEDYTITVSANGTELDSDTFTVNCEVVSPPGPQSAAISHDCDGYSVTLTNDNETAAVFTVTVNGEDRDVSVPAGATRTTTGPVAEDGTYTISVSYDGDELVSTTFDVDCTVVSPPTVATAGIDHDCDTWSVDLDNSDGDEAAQYTIVVRTETDNGADATTQSVTVAPGDTDSVGGDVAEDTTYRIVVRVGDTRVARDTFTVNCTKVSPPGGGTSTNTGSTGGSDSGTSTLPDTGTSVTKGLVGAGLGLLTAGVLALLLGLHRRRVATR